MDDGAQQFCKHGHRTYPPSITRCMKCHPVTEDEKRTFEENLEMVEDEDKEDE